MERFLSVRQASELLALHEATIRRWIRSGDLPAVKVGASVRILQSEIESLIQRPVQELTKDGGEKL